MRSPGGWRRLTCVSLLWGVAITALFTWPLPLVAVWAGLRPQDFVHAPWRRAESPGISDIGYSSSWWAETWTFYHPGEWIWVGGHGQSAPPEPPHWVIRKFGAPDDRTHIVWFGTTATGWPLRAMSYMAWSGHYYPPDVAMSKSTRLDVDGVEFGLRLGKGGTATSRAALVIPLRPIWLGLAADVAFWSVAAFSWVMGVRWMRARRRRRRGLCEACGYPRTGLPPDRACPECGATP